MTDDQADEESDSEVLNIAGDKEINHKINDLTRAYNKAIELIYKIGAYSELSKMHPL